LFKRLPEALGRLFTPVASLGAAIAAALAVLAVIEGAGAIHISSPHQPPALLKPVALSTPGGFQRYLPPFTGSHVVATVPAGVLGFIEDRDHLYVTGFDGSLNRFSHYGGNQAEANPSRLVGADSSLVSQSGRYYFAARRTHPIAGQAPGIYTFDPSTLKPGPLVAALTLPLGMAADPQGDSLFVVASGGLYRIDDLQGQPRVHLVVSGSFDGTTVNADGSRLYVPSGQSVLGFDRSGNQVLKIDLCCHAPDGIVVLGDGTRSGDLDVSGYLFVNANDGTILRVDTYHGNQVTVVASGGQRGDFMTLGIDGCLYAASGTVMVRMEPCFSVPG
jgi:hypothetical protein